MRVHADDPTGGPGPGGSPGPTAATVTPPATPTARPTDRGDGGSGDLTVQVSRNPAVAGEPVGLRVVRRGGGLTAASWSLGDGSDLLAGLSVQHIWARSGSYSITVSARTGTGATLFRTVRLRVVDTAGPTTTPTGPTGPGTTSSSTTTTTTTRADPEPVAALGLSSASTRVGTAVTADATGSSDDGGDLSYEIDWGDGETSTPADGTASHTYTRTCACTVELTVTDAAGQTGTDSASLDVEEPAVFAEGRLEIDQTWTADLDPGSGRDIWFEAQTETERYLTTLGGASGAVVGGSDYNTCLDASLSAGRISMDDLSVGSRVCVLTGAGRYAVVTVVTMPGPSPGVLVLDYRTWTG
ncbi:MAG: PKD domain-containing protein [Actinomycetales bacterium]|nr:PKD domain-containing protein [Actinomycetales bacterium]